MKEKKYKHMTLEDRIEIQECLNKGTKISMPKIKTDTDHAYKSYMYNYMTSLSPSSELGTSLGLDSSKKYFLVEYLNIT